MIIHNNFPLKKINTFGLDYKADSVIRVKNEEEAISFIKGEIKWKKPLMIMGSGSNILFTSDFKGTILLPEMDEIRVEEKNNDMVIVSSGAGVVWDKLVEWTVINGFGGLENLSLIPGMVGASPVQNIGAYGVEVKDSVERVRTIDITDGSIHVFSNNECKFGYRDSVFKKDKKGKYLVTRVYYKLIINQLINLSYGSLKEEVNKLGSDTLRNVRQAVISIRRSKLPDPGLIGNAGSFFKNPVVPTSVAENLKTDNPGMPVYEDQSGGKKLAAGWLIDQCGWKGKRKGDAGVHEKQALVLVNYGKATGKEIFMLSEEIRQSVLNRFGVNLDREVEIIGTI
jgi:UDP-N-acetylmuramate dehydrogenase